MDANQTTNTVQHFEQVTYVVQELLTSFPAHEMGPDKRDMLLGRLLRTNNAVTSQLKQGNDVVELAKATANYNAVLKDAFAHIATIRRLTREQLEIFVRFGQHMQEQAAHAVKAAGLIRAQKPV